MSDLDYHAFVDADCGEAEFRRWADLSNATMQAAICGRPTSINSELLTWAGCSSQKLFRAPYLYWAASNLAIEGDTTGGKEYLEEACAVESGEGGLSMSRAVGRSCRELLAELSISDRRLDDALQHLALMREISHPEDKRAQFLSGIACEHCDDLRSAVDHFAEIADDAYHSDVESYGQLSRRAIDRIERNDDTHLELQDLVLQLSKALQECDSATVRRLYSKSHFAVGLGAHWHFVDGEEVMDHLLHDLRRRAIRVADVESHDLKTYIVTDGWKGTWFAGRVVFRLSSWLGRWSWTGVTTHGSPERYFQCMARPEPETNQPLPFDIRAPWDRGLRPRAKTFMAGGIEVLTESPIITASRGLLGLLGFLPIVGDIARAANAFLETVRPAERARQLALSTRPCGFGLRGFYYNAIASHQGSNAFAIDFTDYNGFFPASDGWPVLSASPGRVESASLTTRDGDDPGNVVEVVRFHDGRPFLFRYLHLAREAVPPVRAGLLITQGTLLGRIDNTGNSAFSHLHFSIHDQTRPHPSGDTTGSGARRGISIRPTPMDGTRLGDGDEARCVPSTNGGPPVVAIGAPLSMAEFRTVTERVVLAARVDGGAAPFTFAWSSDLEPALNFSTTSARGSTVFRVPGRHTIRLTVTDALGRAGTATAVVVITNNLPLVSIVAPNVGETFASNETILLQGRTYDPDTFARLPDSQTAWFLDGGSTSFATGHAGSIPASSLSVGRHRIRFVGDDGSSERDEEREIIIVEPLADRRPEVQILSPADNSSFNTTMRDPMTGFDFRPVDLVGEAIDPEEGRLAGSNLVWTIRDSGGLEEEIGTGQSVRHNFFARGPFSTVYRVTLTATDSSGQDREAFIRISISVLS